MAAKVRESYGDMRKRWGVEEEEDSQSTQADSQSLQLGTLVGITSMRAIGENKRFGDEVLYLLDGLAPSEPLGLRRSRCAVYAE